MKEEEIGNEDVIRRGEMAWFFSEVDYTLWPSDWEPRKLEKKLYFVDLSVNIYVNFIERSIDITLELKWLAD